MKKKLTFTFLLAAIFLILLCPISASAENTVSSTAPQAPLTSSSENCIIMVVGTHRSYFNGTIANTTYYDRYGFVMLENLDGAMQLPLRYIAETNGMTVDYDEASASTKVTNQSTGTYLLIQIGSETVKRFSSDGTLLSTTQAPNAFAVQGGVTIGPLRFTCEALGLSIAYQETSHGTYVMISNVPKTNDEVLAKIKEAYDLGLKTVEINQTNFPDNEFRRLILTDEIVYDGILSPEEIENFTNIKLYHSSVVNCTGIEYLTNLKTLKCEDSRSLKSIKLTNNPSLKEIIINNQHDFLRSELTLDLSGAPNLTTLDCTHTTITSLDLRNNVKLQAINLYDNSALSNITFGEHKYLKTVLCESNSSISSLDLSGAPSLATLKCSSTSLRSLDLSANPMLETLLCFYNKSLTDINLKNNTLLTTLSISSSHLLSDLDLSHNTKLTDLTLSSNILLNNLDLSANTALSNLVISSWTELTSLDLSKNTLLETVKCSANYKITSLILGENSALESLDCSNNSLTQLDVSKLPNLSTLKCATNSIEVLDISSNISLNTLDCSSNKLTYLDFIGNPSLSDLNCSYNALTKLDAEKIPNIITLNCSYNKIKELKNINPKIEKLLCNNNCLSKLDISFYSHSTYVNCCQQTAYTEIINTSEGWIVDIKELTGSLEHVMITQSSDTEFYVDLDRGIVIFSGDTAPTKLMYCYYDTISLSPFIDMGVNLILTPADPAMKTECIIMKENAEQAYINGSLSPTTQYESGYAKLENVNGTMHIPLRYLAEINGFTVDYDAITGNTKVTNPKSGEYLIFTTGSTAVSVYSSEGLLLSITDAPSAFSVKNGITTGPMRFVCEALGMTVLYQETENGNYVIITKGYFNTGKMIAAMDDAHSLGF